MAINFLNVNKTTNLKQFRLQGVSPRRVFLVCLLFGGAVFLIGKKILNPSAICTRCNVILISVDTVRADEFSCYGYTRQTTPTLCRFADRNVRFSNAFSQSTWTFPNEISVFTSLYQSNHRMNSSTTDYLSPTIKTLPQLYKDAGYHTIYAGPKFEENVPMHNGIARSFDEIRSFKTYSLEDQIDLWNQTIEQIRERKPEDPPVFLYIYTSYVHNYVNDFMENIPSYFDPNARPLPLYDLFVFRDQTIADTKELITHNLYRRVGQSSLSDYQSILNQLVLSKSLSEAKEAFLRLTPSEQKEILLKRIYAAEWFKNNPDYLSYARNMYDNRLYLFDTKMEEFLSKIDTPELENNTITVLLSDHGENFGIHGFGHGAEPTDSLTHVPLIMKIPKFASRVVSQVAQLIDIYPTLLSLTGIPSPNNIAGTSLLRALQGKPSSDAFAISELNSNEFQSIRTDAWRLTTYKRPNGTFFTKLFHIPTDPYGINDVSNAHPSIVKQLSEKMRKELVRASVY